MGFRDLFSAWCVALSFTFTIPQAWRVVRRNTVEGISILSQAQGIASASLLFVYGIVSSKPLISTGNGMVVIGIGIVLIQMVRLNVLSAKVLVSIVVGVYGFALIMQAVNLNILAVFAGVIGGAGIVPQVWKAARQSHLRGVSGSGNALLALTTMSWGIYSLMIDDPLLAVSNFALVLPALFISFRAIQSHRKFGSEVASFT